MAGSPAGVQALGPDGLTVTLSSSARCAKPLENRHPADAKPGGDLQGSERPPDIHTPGRAGGSRTHRPARVDQSSAVDSLVRTRRDETDGAGWLHVVSPQVRVLKYDGWARSSLQRNRLSSCAASRRCFAAGNKIDPFPGGRGLHRAEFRRIQEAKSRRRTQLNVTRIPAKMTLRSAKPWPSTFRQPAYAVVPAPRL